MGKLLAGASRKSISPTDDMLPMPDTVFMGDGKYVSVRKDIFVRALAVDNGDQRLVFLVQEVPAVFNTEHIKAHIHSEHGIPVENIFISAVHNSNTTPLVDLSLKMEWGEPVPSIRHRYSRYVIDQSIAAAAEAIKILRPALFGYGKTNSYININRDEQLASGIYIEGRNFKRPSDKTLAVMKFETPNGELIAAVLNYGVHSNMCFRVVDEEGNKTISANLAGEVSEFVEKAYGEEGAVAIWTIAAGGNQNPILSGFHNYFPNGTYERSGLETNPMMYAFTRHLGQRAGMDALRALRSIASLKSDVKIKVSDRLISLPGTRVEGFSQEMLMNAYIIDHSKIHNVDSDPVSLALKLIQLGNLSILGINCELMSEIGIRLKDKATPQELMIISLYENAAAGKYFVDKWGYENRTFAYFRNTVRDACMEDEVKKALDEMFAEIKE